MNVFLVRSNERAGGRSGAATGTFDITPHPCEEHDYSSLVALPNVQPVVPGYRGRGRPPLHLKRQHWSTRTGTGTGGSRTPAHKKREPAGTPTPSVAVTVAPGTIVGTLPSPSTSADGAAATPNGTDAAAKKADEAAAAGGESAGRPMAPLSSVLPLLGLMRKKRGRKPKDPSRLAARLLHDALIGRL